MEGGNQSDEHDLCEEQHYDEEKTRCRTLSEGSDSSPEQGPHDIEKKRQCMSIPTSHQNGFLFSGIPASPPKFISIEQIMEAANGVSNMALAHEIAVNKDFKLDEAGPETSLKKQVKAVVHKAFWDVFQQQLNEQPPDFSQAMVLLGEIKDNLQEILLPHHSRIRSQIDEVLDLDLIQQQVENNALDFQYYARYVISTMSRLCAPARDEKIKELMLLTDVISIYKGILETLDLMKLDMVNFTIQQIRPHIEQHSVEYERQKFQEFLETLADLTSPVDGLEFTRKWFEKVFEKFAASSESKASFSLDVSDTDLITKAYLELLQWDNDEIFPETLLMDEMRFLALRDQLIAATLTASILLVTYSVVGEAIQGISQFKQTLKDHVSVLLEDAPKCSEPELLTKLENVGLQVVKEVDECLEKHGYSTLSEPKKSTILAQITDARSMQHSVRKLITHRILEFVEQILTSPKSVPVKIPAGLSAFQTELLNMGGQFMRLVTHNRSVFGEYYTEIISSIRNQRESLLMKT